MINKDLYFQRTCLSSVLLLYLGSLPAMGAVKVVSTSLAGDDVLREMVAHEPDLGERVVGLSQLCRDPRFVSTSQNKPDVLQKVPCVRTDSAQILQLGGDTVIVSPFNTAPFLREVKRLGIHLVMLPELRTEADLYEVVGKTADAIGARLGRDRMIHQLDHALEEIKGRRETFQKTPLQPWFGTDPKAKKENARCVLMFSPTLHFPGKATSMGFGLS